MKKDIRENPKLLGTINFSPNDDYDNYLGECDIRMYSDEYNFPHFHIIPRNIEGECCVCVYEASYFNHDNGIKQLRLNQNQRNILNEWMKSNAPYLPNSTNWEAISFMWRTGNEFKYVPKNRVQPDYTNIVERR